MRILSLFFILGVVLTTLIHWKNVSDSSWQLCSELSLLNNKSIEIGPGWFFSKGGMKSQDPTVCWEGNCKKLYLDVFVPIEIRNEKMANTIQGNFLCKVNSANPSQYFILRFFRRPQLIAKKFKITYFEDAPNFIDRFSFEYQKQFPLLNALVESVWKGSTSSFDESFVAFYRRGGLSHILAVSGTHVMILYFLLNKIFGVVVLVVPQFFMRSRIWLCRTLLLFLSALLLWRYSPGNAPVHRSLFFLITISALNFKMWKTECVQIVCSGLALLLLYEPNLFLSESFWLSALGALFLSLRSEEEVLKTYVWGILLIPILMAPTVSSVFGQLSLVAPMFSLVFSPLWDVVLIPMGYVSPFVSNFVAGHYLLSVFERVLRFVSSCQDSLYPLIDNTQLVTSRLDLVQTILLTISLVLLVFIASHFRQKTA